MKITKEELAQRLDLMPYGASMSAKDKQDAIDSGLLVIMGQSDDLIDFDGTIYDEADAYEGGTVFLTPSGSIKKKTKNPDAIKIVAEWCPKDIDASWRITTSVQYAQFRVMEDAELFCVGCVIDFTPKE